MKSHAKSWGVWGGQRSGHKGLSMGFVTINSCFILFLHVSLPVVSFPSCLRYLNIALMLHLFPKSSTSGSGHLEYMAIQLKYVKNLAQVV